MARPTTHNAINWPAMAAQRRRTSVSTPTPGRSSSGSSRVEFTLEASKAGAHGFLFALLGRLGEQLAHGRVTRAAAAAAQHDADQMAIAAADVGDEVEGTITRITPFGAFVQISPAVEALVHISELGDGNNPEKLFQLNEKKKFAVIEIDADNRKISLGLTK